MNMKWEDKGLKDPLARAKGLGASHSPVQGWIGLRVAGIAIAVLSIWFIWFLSQTIGQSYYVFTEILARPVNAIMMILLIIAASYHATLGVREIIEDYIHLEWFKVTKLIGSYLFFFACGIACIFSILKIAFTAGM